MRNRLIRPSFWTDPDLGALGDDTRLFYVGLWMLADDGGYLRWEVSRVGAELYPFRSPAWWRSHLPKWLEQLGDHARLLDCGRHVVVPNLAKYQVVPRPSYQWQREHDGCLRTGDHVLAGGPPQHVVARGSTTREERRGEESKERREDKKGSSESSDEWTEPVQALKQRGER